MQLLFPFRRNDESLTLRSNNTGVCSIDPRLPSQKLLFGSPLTFLNARVTKPAQTGDNIPLACH